ncbi:MAG: roadblock/LC7 family protein [Chloroflexi bacterium]|jgi:predicted regulator of Ras-like GTPase activity (Roadblock/LC7/MglB family)|nr:roadblock/LC7 family protein [Chloroflexota bacterium]
MFSGSQLLELQEELHRLQSSSPDIEATALITMDGLILASTLPDSTEEDRVSAMSAALLSLAERISLELGRGYLEQVFLRGAEGDVLLMAVADQAVLTVMSRREAKLGMLIYYMRRAVKELTNFLD